jgi:ABC-type multidrug transport system ATPase subunit
MEASTSENYVHVSHLGKRYDAVQALEDVSFDVCQGELFGIIGPDGAGKTTLFRILATLLLPDTGMVLIHGDNVVTDYKMLRTQVGYMPGTFSLYGDLTVSENLAFFASVFGTTVQDNYHMIKDIYCRLEPFANRRAAKLSGGMKQKLALCCSLIHAPGLLILDEPTTGVDPSSRREFWDMLADLKQRYNITILVSTAYMDEASRCSRILMLHQGHILCQGAPAEIIAQFDSPLWQVKSDSMFRLLGDLRQIKEVSECYTFGDSHHVRLAPTATLTPEALTTYLEQHGHHHVLVRSCSPTMEDCFLNATRKGRNL